MQKAFEKIVERLEEYKTKAYVTGFTNNPYELGACHAMDDAVKIVNKVAKEYNQEVCEWERNYQFFSDKYKVETECGYTFYDLHHTKHFEYCPYCGKKIKVMGG